MSCNRSCAASRSIFAAASGPGWAPDTRALLWTLNLSDGRHSLLDIAERSGLGFPAVKRAAAALAAHGLLEESP